MFQAFLERKDWAAAVTFFLHGGSPVGCEPPTPQRPHPYAPRRVRFSREVGEGEPGLEKESIVATLIRRLNAVTGLDEADIAAIIMRVVVAENTRS